MPRQNTHLESEGAEFLVLGQLLIQGIPSYKTYTNMPGYDIVATNPERNCNARIQVKSRWKTKAEGFIINNFDCDFVVIVRLNRGSKDGRADVLPPEYFIFPVGIVKKLPRTGGGWGKVSFSHIKELDYYRENWKSIKVFLDKNKCEEIIIKILSVEKLIDGGESAWIDDGEKYRDMAVYPDNTTEEMGSFPKSNYDNYEHFVGVMGKFNPYTIFRKNPVEVDKLDYEMLVELRHSFEQEK